VLAVDGGVGYPMKGRQIHRILPQRRRGALVSPAGGDQGRLCFAHGMTELRHGESLPAEDRRQQVVSGALDGRLGVRVAVHVLVEGERVARRGG